MFGISTINIELTSRCNKECVMCGRRKLEAMDPNYKDTLGDMDFGLYEKIITQIETGMTVQLYWNGEPTLYPYLARAAALAKDAGANVCMDTNGLLLGKFKECYDFDSITVSVISGDSPENYQKQIENIHEFCADNTTMINLRLLGDDIPMYAFDKTIEHFRLQKIRRTLHIPDMSRDYEKPVIKPEIGVCLDLLHHLAIDIKGDVYPCVRFNPNGLLKLGNVNDRRLADIAGGQARKILIEEHFAGHRKNLLLCGVCDYYGCPIG